jgi:hypothetical protein
MRFRWTVAAFGVLAALPAQRVQLAGDGRQVAVVDVGDLLPAPFVESVAKQDPARFAASRAADLGRLAQFVRAFAMPNVETGADLQPLGDRHLVLLGSPVQIATAERILVRARENPDRQFQVDIRLCDVPAAVFDRHVAPALPEAIAASGFTCQRTAVLVPETVGALLRALKQEKVKLTQFPQVVVPGMHRAKLMVGKHVTFVRDFELEVAGGACIANPIVDTVFDGHDVEVLCAELRAGVLGVQLELVDQVVEQPIPERTTTVPGTKQEVVVHAPRVAGCRGSMTVELANGATALMAARKPDGAWIVLVMTPVAIRSGPVFPQRK